MCRKVAFYEFKLHFFVCKLCVDFRQHLCLKKVKNLPRLTHLRCIKPFSILQDISTSGQVDSSESDEEGFTEKSFPGKLTACTYMNKGIFLLCLCQ